MSRVGIWFVLLMAIVATIGCDRVTKHVAATTLSGTPGHSFLADTFRLEYVENAGAFLSVGADWPLAVRNLVFGAGNALLLIALAALAVGRRWPQPALFGIALLIAGGASNLLDRFMSGTVIDFMNIGIGPLRTGVFNFADVAITVGACILGLEAYRAEQSTGPDATS